MSTTMKKLGLLIGLAAIIGLAIGYYVWDSQQTQDPSDTDASELVYERPETIESLEEQYDVIVIGGEPEGVAAAVSAARNGAKTLLVEHRQDLGGLFTLGMLNFLDIPQGEDGSSASKGIFEEWHKMVGNQSAFGIDEAKAAFTKLVQDEENLTLAMNTAVTDVTLENQTVTAIQVENEYGEYTISADSFIDATQDADFAVMAGAPHYLGGEDIGQPDKKMAVTLVLHLKNVDWDGVRETAKSEKFGYAEVTNSAAWGFSKLHFDYQPAEENVRLRGLNLAKVGDEYFINALQIFEVDGLSEESKAAAIEKGIRETDRIVEYLRAEFQGFENAEVISYPEELYVRETRHVKAEYQLPMADVWMNRDHWDSIAIGAYPVDVQAQSIDDYGNVISDPLQYAIPFRSIVPLDVDGLLVVGRSAGYSSVAAGSVRIVPTGMSTGEAAGVAAVVAQEESLSFRELSKDEALIEEIRTRLTEQGQFVEAFELSYPYEGEFYDEAIQKLINYALVAGGYVNELPVDKPVNNNGFFSLTSRSIERINADQPELVEAAKEKNRANYKQDDVDMTKEQIIEQFGQFAQLDQPATTSADLVNAGVISQQTAEYLDAAEPVTFKELYVMISDLVDYLDQR